jgi:hypothetical protein
MKLSALIGASYSDRSSEVRWRSFASSLRASIRAITCGSIRNATKRRADSESRQRLKGYGSPSSPVAAFMPQRYPGKRFGRNALNAPDKTESLPSVRASVPRKLPPRLIIRVHQRPSLPKTLQSHHPQKFFPEP